MSRKLKKFGSVIITLVMALALSMTAFAAGSPTASGLVTKATSVTTSDGTEVEVVVQEVPEEYQQEAQEIQQTENLKAVLGSAYVEGMKVVDVKDITVIDLNGMTVDAARAAGLFPVTITFEVPGVLPTTKVAVLHWPEDGSGWEVVPSTAGNGTVTATFNSLSPVAFVIDENTAASAVGSTGSSSSGSAVSPKTGESPVIPFVSAAAVVLLAGAGLCLRNKKLEMR